jgi:cytosine/adenosine deaminase-related metal-dependent hydrolase
MLILKNATYIDWKTLDFKITDITIEEGLEGKIDFVDNSKNSQADIIDCTGLLVTKSFAVGHHHAYSALSRGMGAPKKSPENFYEILKYIWWTLDKSLDEDMIKASAYATAIACVKAGASFVIDHHASPFYINGSLEILAEAFDEVGLGHLLCYEISDRDGLDKAEEGLLETENYLKHHQGLVGLHASFTVGDNSLKKAADLMEKFNSGIHVHIAEDQYDQDFTLKNYGKRVIERLNGYGFLNASKTILGHCLHLSDSERSIIKSSKSWVVQNTESNLNNNVGYFNSAGLNTNIMLGTDGMHSDIIRSAQQAFFVGQGFDRIDVQETYRRFRNVHHYLSQNNFKGDGDNNLVVLDYKSPTPMTKDNFLGHFIFGFQSSDVKHLIANGKLILKNKIIQTVNEDDLLKFTKEQALLLWTEMKKE